MAQSGRPGQFNPGDMEIPKIDKKFVYPVVGVILIIWLLLSSVYTIDADKVGVIQRFGRYTTTTGSGIHLKIPFGIEKVTKVSIKNNYKQEFGFRTQKAGVRTQYKTGNYLAESAMLTGDLNTATVEWIVQFQIKDPIKYLFKVRRIESTIRNVCEAAMRAIVGDKSVDEVITIERELISTEVAALMQTLLDEYETGIDVITVNLQDVNPPKAVQDAFNAVNEAEQEKERIINDAQKAYNKVIPLSRGQALKKISQAEGYAINRVNRAKGEATKFMAIYKEYTKAKEVTRRRMYLETMLEILPNIKDLYIIDEDQEGILPLLQLQKGKDSK